MPLPRTVPNDKESSEPSPAPPSASGTPAPTNGNAAPTTLADTQNANGEAMIDPELASLPAPGSLSITESIAQAPNPRPADFSMLPLTHEELDLSALDPASLEGAPGSPTAKLMKAIAPPNAAQPDTKWPTVSDPTTSRCVPRKRKMREKSEAHRTRRKWDIAI